MRWELRLFGGEIRSGLDWLGITYPSENAYNSNITHLYDYNIYNIYSTRLYNIYNIHSTHLYNIYNRPLCNYRTGRGNSERESVVIVVRLIHSYREY